MNRSQVRISPLWSFPSADRGVHQIEDASGYQIQYHFSLDQNRNTMGGKRAGVKRSCPLPKCRQGWIWDNSTAPGLPHQSYITLSHISWDGYRFLVRL